MNENRIAQLAALERAVLDGKGTLSPEERRVFAYEDELPSPWEPSHISNFGRFPSVLHVAQCGVMGP